LNTVNTALADTRHAVLVLPLHLLTVNATYWQVCLGQQGHCIGLFDDLHVALMQAIDVAKVRSHAGQPVQVLVRRSTSSRWKVVWPPAKRQAAPAAGSSPQREE
jgi:hypothetical protein